MAYSLCSDSNVLGSVALHQQEQFFSRNDKFRFTTIEAHQELRKDQDRPLFTFLSARKWMAISDGNFR